MNESLIILSLFGRDIRVGSLFRVGLIISLSIHIVVASAYIVKTYVFGSGVGIVSSAMDLRPIEIDMDIPPELLGGRSSPAPVEKQEWVEGQKKTGDDPETEDVSMNKVSGDGTDKDGYLFSFNGDRPPTAIINFDLRRYYPEAAKAANILEYTVTVLVQIDEKGKLISASIASGQAMYGFNDAALKVVNRARFAPGYKEGKPVKMVHHLPIRFILEN
ncbi:MAG: energy transducer TonB [Leptospirales bacterium]|nr:energy transducer TonB [Leptospirales bacterium]